MDPTGTDPDVRGPGPTPRSEGPEPAEIVRLGLIFYGVMAVVAVVWRTGLYGEPIFFARPDEGAGSIAWPRDLVVGVGTGLGIVAVSGWMTRRTTWGEALARTLARPLAGLSVSNAVLLAFASGLAEEMLFRGALQPRVGWLLASLLFGVVHYAPGRELLPWTGFAVMCGLVLGGLFEWTGNLIAPVTAHVVVNAVNLPWLIRDYGPDGPRSAGGPGP